MASDAVAMSRWQSFTSFIRESFHEIRHKTTWPDLPQVRQASIAIIIFVLLIGLVITLAFNIAAFIIRYYEYDSLHFKWNDNAYGSVTWMILGMHMLHIIVLGCEDIYLFVWTFVKGDDDKHALDLTVTAVYWYWIVGIWIPLFLLVYILPRAI